MSHIVMADVKVVAPEECFPEIGTVANPAAFYDGADVYLCYEVSPRGGDGNVILKFGDVIDFHKTPVSVGSRVERRYPVKPWTFNEIIGGDETAGWAALKPHFWLISFNDVTVEILFETVTMIGRDNSDRTPQQSLLVQLTN